MTVYFCGDTLVTYWFVLVTFDLLVLASLTRKLHAESRYRLCNDDVLTAVLTRVRATFGDYSRCTYGIARIRNFDAHSDICQMIQTAITTCDGRKRHHRL